MLSCPMACGIFPGQESNCFPCIGRQTLHHWTTSEVPKYTLIHPWFFYSPLVMEKAMAPHSSTLTWKIPWVEEPGGLQSMGSLRVGHDWVTSLPLFTFMHWRRKWQPTPVFLPGRIPGIGEPGGLPSMGSHRVGHDWSDLVVVVVVMGGCAQAPETSATFF